MELGTQGAPEECSIDEMITQWRLGARLEDWRARYVNPDDAADGDQDVLREPRAPSWSLLELLAQNGVIRRAAIRLKIQERLIDAKAVKGSVGSSADARPGPIEMPESFVESVRSLWRILDEPLNGMRVSRLAREEFYEGFDTPENIDLTEDPVWIPLDDVLSEARVQELLDRLLEQQDGHIELEDILAVDAMEQSNGTT